MDKDVAFTDIFSKLIENFERVIKAISGVPYLTTVLAVLIVLCLASVVAYMFWKSRRRAMAWLFFVCLGLFSAFGLAGVIGQWPKSLASTEPFIVGKLIGLDEYDPAARKFVIKRVIVPTSEPTAELLVYTTNNGEPPRFEWVVRFKRAVTCRTFVKLHVYDKDGAKHLHTLYVPLFGGGTQTGTKHIDVNVLLSAKEATAEMDGQPHDVSLDQPPTATRECNTARLDAAPAREKRTGLRWSIIGSALAQTRSVYEEEAFRAGLESQSPVIRVQSRTELARRGDEALPWIKAVIRDSKSSDLLLASIIGALIDMQAKRSQLDKPAVDRLLDFLTAENTELRRSARNLLGRIADAEIVADLAKRFAAAKAQGPESGKAARLAFSVLEVNYAYGIRKYFEFDKNEKDLEAYRAAIAAFQAIVAAVDAVGGEDKARFARGHWGQIVAKHHHYWMLPPASTEARALRAELMTHFQAVLAAEKVKDEAGRTVYRYRNHIDAARRCTTGEYTRNCMKGGS